MKKYIIILLIPCFVGCAAIKEKWPSGWDPNQSKVVTDLRYDTAQIDCAGDYRSQLSVIKKDVVWFHLYSESKETYDVDKLMKPLEETLDGFIERSKQGDVSPSYCEIKKKLLIQQSEIIAKTVQGRF